MAGNRCWAGEPNSPSYLEWNAISELPPSGDQSESLGVAGPFVGVSNDVLIVAGGANFPKPYWGEAEVWHDDIWVLDKSGDWHPGGKLPRPIGYGSSVTTDLGVLCMGGNDASQTYDDVFLLNWNTSTKTMLRESLPSLPSTLVYGAATTLGQKVYLAGGSETNELSTALKNFWVLDLDEKGSDSFRWKKMPAWPGPTRGFNVLATQNNGREEQVYLFSGRHLGENGELEFLKDAYAYSPSRSSWKRLADSPACMMAGEAIPSGQNHVLVIGGADGSLFHRADDLKDEHPGFPKQIWGYNALTDTWQKAGNEDILNLVEIGE